jgi:hypothetical protein
MLATLRGVKADVVRKVLHADASDHAEQGFYLEHLWQNVNDPEEVLFLFRVDDLEHAKKFIEEAHLHSREIDPDGTLPHMKFLEEK